jgi:hypothetical protein
MLDLCCGCADRTGCGLVQVPNHDAGTLIQSVYQRVVVALKETIRLMKEIDKAIVRWPIE